MSARLFAAESARAFPTGFCVPWDSRPCLRSRLRVTQGSLVTAVRLSSCGRASAFAITDVIRLSIIATSLGDVRSFGCEKTSKFVSAVQMLSVSMRQLSTDIVRMHEYHLS